MNHRILTWPGYLIVLALWFAGIISCDSGVEPSPDPGILRITLQSDPADTAIVIVADTFYVANNDSFGVTIFQGRVYNDTVYSILYPTLRSYRQEDITYNLIRLDSSEYRKYVIFESYAPPGDYDRIQFGLKATVLRISNFDEIKVESPPNVNPLVDLYANFRVSENSVTEIGIQIKPFQSIQRYRDTYQFYPNLEIKSVKYK